MLADIGMPGKNGYEVAQYIKQSPRLAHIPVVLLTGAFEPVDQARAAEAGCDGVLAKPFEPQLVIGRVKELLASRPAPPGAARGAADRRDADATATATPPRPVASLLRPAAGRTGRTGCSRSARRSTTISIARRGVRRRCAPRPPAQPAAGGAAARASRAGRHRLVQRRRRPRRCAASRTMGSAGAAARWTPADPARLTPFAVPASDRSAAAGPTLSSRSVRRREPPAAVARRPRADLRDGVQRLRRCRAPSPAAEPRQPPTRRGHVLAVSAAAVARGAPRAELPMPRSPMRSPRCSRRSRASRCPRPPRRGRRPLRRTTTSIEQVTRQRARAALRSRRPRDGRRPRLASRRAARSRGDRADQGVDSVIGELVSW